MKVLELIFSSFWTFLGTIIIIGVTLDGIADIVKAFRNKT